MQDLIIESSDDKDNESAILFAEWMKEQCEKLNVTEDYFLLEFF